MDLLCMERYHWYTNNTIACLLIFVRVKGVSIYFYLLKNHISWVAICAKESTFLSLHEYVKRCGMGLAEWCTCQWMSLHGYNDASTLWMDMSVDKTAQNLLCCQLHPVSTVNFAQAQYKARVQQLPVYKLIALPICPCLFVLFPPHLVMASNVGVKKCISWLQKVGIHIHSDIGQRLAYDRRGVTHSIMSDS